MASKIVTLNAGETAATVADAVMSDIFTTAVSMNSAVTGMYGLVQKVGLVAVGMAVQNNRLGRGFNFISAE